MRGFLARGQASVEYMLLTGFLLLMVAVGFGYALVTYNDSVRLSQMDQASKRLRYAVMQVHLAGHGNQRIVEVTNPPGLTELNVLHICNQALYNGGSVSAQGTAGATATDYCRLNRSADCDNAPGTQLCGHYPFSLYSAIELRAEGDFTSLVYTPAVVDQGLEDTYPLFQGTHRFRVRFDPLASTNVIKIEELSEGT